MHANAAVANGTEAVPLSSEILMTSATMGYPPGRLRVPRGELVSLQHGRGRGIHVLSEGHVKILRFSAEGRVILLDLVEPGGIFGEPALGLGRVLREGAPCYAEAIDNAVLHTIPVLTFERVLRQRPQLALGIASLLGERCSKLERRLEARVFERVPMRLGNQLLELAERYGVPHDAGTLLSIALNQQDLANLIGASREIVSLTLSELKRRGLVTSEGRRLVVREDNLRGVLAAGAL